MLPSLSPHTLFFPSPDSMSLLRKRNSVAISWWGESRKGNICCLSPSSTLLFLPDYLWKSSCLPDSLTFKSASALDLFVPSLFAVISLAAGVLYSSHPSRISNNCNNLSIYPPSLYFWYHFVGVLYDLYIKDPCCVRMRPM